MAPREVSHTPHGALGWAAMGAVLFQVGGQAAEVWDRSLGPVQMAASSADPLRVLFPQNVYQPMGPVLHGGAGGSLFPGYKPKLACGPRPQRPRPEQNRMDFGVPKALAQSAGQGQCVEAFGRKMTCSRLHRPRTRVPSLQPAWFFQPEAEAGALRSLPISGPPA